MSKELERIHKYKADYGLPDYREFYKKRYNSDIKSREYSRIIREFNDALTDLIVEDSLTYLLPYIRFEINIRKIRRRPRIEDGVLINPNGVDWKSTNELWERSEDAKKKKLLIRYNNPHTSGYVFRMYCKKFRSNVRNRSYFKAISNRKFKNKIKKRIMDPDKDNYDAYLLYKQ